ncbi:MarC family NAAT transporter [Lysobacter sp. GCM10012299]|uniref:MarC family NAAT transporter n=1 Tax=Lysobacter sp. GCM10012299 TaxID=3317333 RepID=UPI0036192262
MLELIKVVGMGLAMVLPLANPISTVAVMLGLSKGMSEQERRRQSRLCAYYVFAIMTVAYYTGQQVMSVFGITLSGLRIAGGLIVAFIGFRMLFPGDHPEDDPEVEQRLDEQAGKARRDIAFIPLAMPTTAGPGTIALLISTAAMMEDEKPFAPWVMQLGPVLVFFLSSVIVWLCLRSANTIMRWLGHSGVEALSRLMGFLLVCMGVQFAINGVLDIIEGYPLTT